MAAACASLPPCFISILLLHACLGHEPCLAETPSVAAAAAVGTEPADVETAMELVQVLVRRTSSESSSDGRSLPPGERSSPMRPEPTVADKIVELFRAKDTPTAAAGPAAVKGPMAPPQLFAASDAPATTSAPTALKQAAEQAAATEAAGASSASNATAVVEALKKLVDGAINGTHTTAEGPTAVAGPETADASAASKAPSAMEVTAAAEAPAAARDAAETAAAPADAGQLATVEGPEATETPAASAAPLGTAAPSAAEQAVTTEAPAAAAEGTETTGAPADAGKPAAVEGSGAPEAPTVSEASAVTEAPRALEQATAAEATAASEAPAATEAVEATDSPAAAEGPTAVEDPGAAEAPAASEAPEATEAPAVEQAAATEAPAITNMTQEDKKPRGPTAWEVYQVSLTVPQDKVEERFAGVWDCEMSRLTGPKTIKIVNGNVTLHNSCEDWSAYRNNSLMVITHPWYVFGIFCTPWEGGRLACSNGDICHKYKDWDGEREVPILPQRYLGRWRNPENPDDKGMEVSKTPSGAFFFRFDNNTGFMSKDGEFLKADVCNNGFLTGHEVRMKLSRTHTTMVTNFKGYGAQEWGPQIIQRKDGDVTRFPWTLVAIPLCIILFGVPASLFFCSVLGRPGGPPMGGGKK